MQKSLKFAIAVFVLSAALGGGLNVSGLVRPPLAALLFAVATLALAYIVGEFVGELKSGSHGQTLARALAANIRVGSLDVKSEHLAIGLVMMIGAGLIWIFISYSHPEPWRGWLQAANDPMPDTPCGRNLQDDEIIMALGHEGVLLGKTAKIRAVSIGECDSLTLERSPDGLLVGAVIYDDKGDKLGTISDNGYEINREGLIVEREGLSTLVVHNSEHKEVLYVKYLNPQAIRVRGMFFCPSHPGVSLIVSDKRMVAYPIRAEMADCIKNSNGLCLFCR
jgi:hypothetical protein